MVQLQLGEEFVKISFKRIISVTLWKEKKTEFSPLSLDHFNSLFTGPTPSPVSSDPKGSLRFPNP